MYRLYFKLLPMLLLLLACSRPDGDDSLQKGVASGSLVIRVEAPEQPAGKAAVPGESAIGHWAWWIFNQKGRAVKCGSGGALSEKVTLLSGRYTLVVVANAPLSGSWALPVQAGGTLESLSSRISDLSSNRPDALLMYGSESVEIEDGRENDIRVYVRRLVSKLGIRQVKVQYDNPSLQERTTLLTGIYLTNICRRTALGADFTPGQLSADLSLWYNAMGWHRLPDQATDPAIDALVGKRDIGHVLTAETPFTTPVYLYAYPNPSPLSADSRGIDGWCIRSTRLVVETQVDGRSFYYALTVPPMARNCPYMAESVTLRDLGSSDPEAVIPGSFEVEFSSESEKGWDAEYLVNEES